MKIQRILQGAPTLPRNQLDSALSAFSHSWWSITHPNAHIHNLPNCLKAADAT